jgi:virginiamycin B lyase
MKNIPGKNGYTVANGSKHTVRIDSQGRVWVSGNPLTMFDPEMGQFTHFDEVPESYTIEFDKGENVWFTSLSSGKIGRVDAQTRKVTQWVPPTPNSQPHRLKIDSDGSIWFGYRLGSKLVHFDPKTETFKEYSLPGPDPVMPYGLAIDSEHDVWYAPEQQDYLGRLDPRSGKVTEYPFPDSEMTIRDMSTDSQGRTWFGQFVGNKVGYFYLADVQNGK